MNILKLPKAAWTPTREVIENANLTVLIKAMGFQSYSEFHTWSHECYPEFWELIINRLQIPFHQPYQTICDRSLGLKQVQWLKGAKMNCVDACFLADPDSRALIYQAEGSSQSTAMTYQELNAESNRVAHSLIAHGFKPGDAIGMVMPMHALSVIVYLGIIKSGCQVVGIADSFSANEISIRLKIADAKGVFTQDVVKRRGDRFSLYEKIRTCEPKRIIVITSEDSQSCSLRSEDMLFNDFLQNNILPIVYSANPDDFINILFSSGTTGEPKAIPWTHLTALKAASDGYCHQDIHPNHVVSWPTSLGWMMGPWLIFATLLNRGTLALYGGAPLGRDFGEFVQNNRVNILGVVPSMVSTWRSSQCMQGLDWSSIHLYTSTAECSNPDDMLFLMGLSGNKPIIEYCGGTELGGGYLTGTILQPCIPGTFTTPAAGINFKILDESGDEASIGEVALIPPSVGFSMVLLNGDHEQVYFQGMPVLNGIPLRRHGDQIQRLDNGYFRALGRVDDTMKLGGIKISSIEIERILNVLEFVKEAAAVAVDRPNGGPSLLVIYAVFRDIPIDTEGSKKIMQETIKRELNPLFKIHEVIPIVALPRTASNKVMRRRLRSEYEQNRQ